MQCVNANVLKNTGTELRYGRCNAHSLNRHTNLIRTYPTVNRIEPETRKPIGA